MRRLVFDARWAGPHGIGRFAREVRARLAGPVVDVVGAHPVSARGLLESEVLPHRAGRRGDTYFSPGYTPCLSWRGPHAFTVHDLIHLDVREERSRAKDAYYSHVVRRAVRGTGAVLTVSDFSRRRIAEWADVDVDRIAVVGNGVDPAYRPEGGRRVADWPYLLHVGNTRPHKNLPRVLAALAGVPDVHLVCTSAPDPGLVSCAARQNVSARLHFLSGVAEEELPAWYRGAEALVIASLYEGFGLPALEGMACGTPVIASSTTALGEVVGDAAVRVEPTDVDSIREGLARGLGDDGLRDELRRRGPERASAYTWDTVAAAVGAALGGGR